MSPRPRPPRFIAMPDALFQALIGMASAARDAALAQRPSHPATPPTQEDEK